jgi:hypothetical protein
MAAGPLPKAQHARERDTRRRQGDAITLYPDGVVRGPELPGGYQPETVEWYETWRRSPQAQLFQATDWMTLRRLARLYDDDIRRGSAAAKSEIRLAEEKWGATVADRLRLKIRVEDGPVALSPDASTSRPVASITDRLRRDPAPEAPAPF